MCVDNNTSETRDTTGTVVGTLKPAVRNTTIKIKSGIFLWTKWQVCHRMNSFRLWSPRYVQATVFFFFYSTVNCHPKHSFHSVYVDIVLLNGWEQSTCLVSVPTFQVALIKENIRKTYRPIIILCGLEKSDSDPVNNNYWPEKSVQFQNI